jgi:hypothetical protein
LATALAEDIHPPYPPVLDCFEEHRAVDMLRRLPEEMAKIYLKGTGYTLREEDYEQTEPPFAEDADGKQYLRPSLQLLDAFSKRLGVADFRRPHLLFPDAFFTRAYQEFPSLLRRLADYTEARLSDPKPDPRPTVSGMPLRALARDLAKYFLASFDKTPNEIIAACVRLYFPDFEPSPGEATIREWRGVK